ncbi:MAG: ATP-binding protein [Pseudomonadota bacterium]
MSRFFWRIFLSVWVIVLSTLFLTANLAGWLTEVEPAVPPGAQLVDLVARDLRATLATQAPDPALIAERYAIDLAPLLEVFVLDPVGRDVLDRPVPELVYRAMVGEEVAWWLPADWPLVSIETAGLAGYTVASFEGAFIFGRVLADPRARVLLIAVALTVSVIVSLLLAHFVVKPVRRLREAGRLVASGDLSVRVAPALGKRQDALAGLAHDFDFMTERVAGSLATQQQLMRDVSHELRSPLARLQALVSVAGQRDDAASPELLGRFEGELERLDELIGEILAFSRLQMQERVSRTRTDLVDLVQTIADDASIEAEAAGKALTLTAPEPLVLDVDHGLVHSAIENVVRNAVRHTARDTTVDIEVSSADGSARVVVSDRGPGVPDAALEAMFRPFYRIEDGRPTDSGSGGIGLAIAARAAALHGGTVTAHNRDGGGLAIAFALPFTDA